MEKISLQRQKVEEKTSKAFSSSLCTIQVSGMNDTTSKDMLEFYFNKMKSGGGCVQEVKGEVEDGVLFITFENEKSKFAIVLKYKNN